MTPPPDEQPLSRRQLREQQRQTTGSAPASRRVSAPAVTGGEIPDLVNAEVPEAAEKEAADKAIAEKAIAEAARVDASASPVEQVSTDQADAVVDDDRPLTRREARLQRTAAVDVISAAPVAPAEADSTDEQTPAAEEMAEPETPAYAGEAETPVVLPRPIVEDSDEDPVIAIAAEAADRADAVQPEREAEPKHPLSSAFGKAVEQQQEKPQSDLNEAPFDQIIARGIESAATSSNSLILPSMPTTGPLTGPITASGDVIITGSIDLPAGLGSTGQHPQMFDKSDIDAMFEADEDQVPSTAGTPVSASKAVSTHTATRDVINPPAPSKSNRMLMVLAITAGALALAVLAVVIVGFATGALGGS